MGIELLGPELQAVVRQPGTLGMRLATSAIWSCVERWQEGRRERTDQELEDLKECCSDGRETREVIAQEIMRAVQRIRGATEAIDTFRQVITWDLDLVRDIGRKVSSI